MLPFRPLRSAKRAQPRASAPERKAGRSGAALLPFEDRDRPALAGRLEVDGAGAGREDRVVAAEAGALAGAEAGAALADDDLAAADGLAGEDLHTEHLRVR